MLWLLVGCVVVTVVIGLLVVHQSQAGAFDRSADSWLRAAFGGRYRLPHLAADLAEPVQYTLAAAVIVGACLAAGRLRGAVLTAVSLPGAIVVTEFLLKPLVGRTLGGHLVYPSGHASRAFALATVIAVLLLGPQAPRWPLPARLALAVTALLVAACVAVAVTAIRYHYFSDTLGGAAVGAGSVVATALALDWIAATLPAWRHRR